MDGKGREKERGGGKTRKIGDRERTWYSNSISTGTLTESNGTVTIITEIVDRWGAFKRSCSVMHRSAKRSNGSAPFDPDGYNKHEYRDLRLLMRNSTSVNTRWKAIIDHWLALYPDIEGSITEEVVKGKKEIAKWSFLFFFFFFFWRKNELNEYVIENFKGRGINKDKI